MIENNNDIYFLELQLFLVKCNNNEVKHKENNFFMFIKILIIIKIYVFRTGKIKKGKKLWQWYAVPREIKT